MTGPNDYLMMIDGEMTAAESGQWLTSLDPANEEELGRVPLASAADIERAVKAGLCAQPDWNDTPVVKRAALLREVGRRLIEQQKDILELEVRDTGNTIGKMRHDPRAGVAQLDYYAGLGLEVKGETVPASPLTWHLTIREPYGMVGRIVPFNHRSTLPSAHSPAR